MHALALIAPFTPGLIADALPTLESIFRNDKSTIVRDYAIIAVGNLAKVGPAYAKLAYPLLNLSLTLHSTKQAKHGLDGFRKSAIHLQDKKNRIGGNRGYLFAVTTTFHSGSCQIFTKNAERYLTSLIAHDQLLIDFRINNMG